MSACPSHISRAAALIYFTLSSGSACVSECSLAWRRSSRFHKVTAWFWWRNTESRPGGTARPLKPIWGCNCRPEYAASPAPSPPSLWAITHGDISVSVSVSVGDNTHLHAGVCEWLVSVQASDRLFKVTLSLICFMRSHLCQPGSLLWCSSQ